MWQGKHIKRLTVTTVLILSGIVALQFYWLLTSYQQQQERFHSDIDNALASTSTRLMIQKTLATQPEEIRKMFNLEELAADGNENGKAVSGKHMGNTLQLISPVIKVKDSAALKSLKTFIDSSILNTTNGSKVLKLEIEFTDSDLVAYKKIYAKELKARQIKVPFDLALVDTANIVYAATCDTAAFRKYAYRSSFNELPGTAGNFGLVAGFQNPNYFVLRNMIWILGVTLTLIILGCWSLIYLLLAFFRQGRIAEIRNDFMNNMTHELKTPISSISLAFEMALDERFALSPEKRTSFLLSAQKETSRLKLIVENVLKILSLEKAELDIIKSDIQIKPWLNTIMERITPLLEKKQVAVQIRIEPESLLVHADDSHMSNVIYNILENAIKYNDKAAPLIRILIDEQQDHIRFSIRDNGQGIPEKYLNKVFDKFFRVPKGYQHDVKGYGLGLSYVKRVVEMHGGYIIVRSTAGAETEFVIHLPLNQLQ